MIVQERIKKYFSISLVKFISLILIFPLYSQDIAFVGNSITASGYGLIVESLLTGYISHNYGIPGICVAVDGYQYKNTQEFQDVLSLKPQHVVMLLGTNDWKTIASQPSSWTDYWVEEYKYLIKKFKKNSNVILGTISYHVYDPTANSTIDILNDKIKNIAKSKGLKIIDFNKALGLNPAYFKSDGIHPSGEGRRVMSQAAYDILKYYPAEEPFVPTILPAPEKFTAELKSTYVQLKWKQVDGASFYKVNRANPIPNTGQYQYDWFNYIDSTKYSDYNIQPDITYLYTVQAVQSTVLGKKSKVVMVTTLDIDHKDKSNYQFKFSCYPNPFNSSTTIEYSILRDSHIMIIIYDFLGNLVKTINDNDETAGNHYVKWNGTDSKGNMVSSGFYFCNIITKDFSQTEKMILLK